MRYEVQEICAHKHAQQTRLAVRDCARTFSFERDVGNRLGPYWSLRAFASFAGVDFWLLRSADMPLPGDQLSKLLPDVVPASATGPNTAAFSYVCKRLAVMPRLLTHYMWLQRHWWAPFAPQLARELKMTLATYRSRDSPFLVIDDVALHVRLGDTLGYVVENERILDEHTQTVGRRLLNRGTECGRLYGLLPLESIDSIIPANVTTIGIVTQHDPDHVACDPGARTAICATGIDHCRSVCDCATARAIRLLRASLRLLRPSAVVTVRHSEPKLHSWVRLAFAPLATICQPSTFCLWPTIAAVRGHMPPGIFKGAQEVAEVLPSFRAVSACVIPTIALNGRTCDPLVVAQNLKKLGAVHKDVEADGADWDSNRTTPQLDRPLTTLPSVRGGHSTSMRSVNTHAAEICRFFKGTPPIPFGRLASCCESSAAVNFAKRGHAQTKPGLCLAGSRMLVATASYGPTGWDLLNAVLDNLLDVHREGVHVDVLLAVTHRPPLSTTSRPAWQLVKTAELFSAQVGGRLMGHFTAAFQRAVAQTTHDWFMQTEHDSWFNILSAAAGRRPAG